MTLSSGQISSQCGQPTGEQVGGPVTPQVAELIQQGARTRRVTGDQQCVAGGHQIAAPGRRA